MWRTAARAIGVALAAVILSVVTPVPGADFPTPAEIREMTDVGRNEEAAAAASALLADVEDRHGANSPQVAEALELLARALARAHQGDTKNKVERLALAERALDIRREVSGGSGPELAWSYYVVGLVHNMAWDPASALEPFEAALRVADAHYGEMHAETEAYVREYGTALYGVGRYEEALRVFERYREISEAKYGSEKANTLPAFYNLALTNNTLGNLDEADDALQQAEVILTRQNPLQVQSLIWVRSLRGTLLAERGRLGDSLNLYEQTLALARERLAPGAPEITLLLDYIGLTLLDLGDYERARRVLNDGLRAAETDRSATITACSMRYNLARALHALDDLSSSRSSFEAFERSAAKTLDANHPLWGPFHADYAALLLDLGEPTAAREHLDRALALHRESVGEMTLDYAEALAHAGSLDLAEGDAAGARRRLERAVEIFGAVAGPNQRYHSTQEELSEALYALRELDEAFETAIAAARAAHEFDRFTIAVLPERQASARAIRPKVARDIATTIVVSSDGVPESWRSEAYDVLVRSRAMVFDEIASRRRRWVDADDSELLALVDAWSEKRTSVANLFMLGPRSGVDRYVARLSSAQDEVERLEVELARASSRYRGLLRGREVDGEALLAALGPDDALLSFIRYGRASTDGREREAHYAAVVLRHGDAGPTWVGLGPAAGLDAATARWRSTFEPSRVASGDSSSQRDPAAELRRILWGPVASRLAGTRTVFVVPDGALNLVSFAALPSTGDRFLLEDGPAFHYLTAERDLILAGESSDDPAEGLLVVGNPAFNRAKGLADGSESAYRGSAPACSSFRTQRFGPLPGAGQEARVVRDLWSAELDEPVTELTGRKATEAEVKRRSSGRRVLHMATHGFFLGAECAGGDGRYRGIGGVSPRRSPEQHVAPRISNPLLLSGLVFAGANHREIDGETDGEDGLLTAEEVATLDLRGVELAVLSACRTGAGSVTAGEGLFGLRRAFLLAGARTVVTNLWDVEDRTARAWIERLYRERFIDGRSMPDAMRAASRSVLDARRAAGLDTHPFYWAGWLAVGGS